MTKTNKIINWIGENSYILTAVLILVIGIFGFMKVYKIRLEQIELMRELMRSLNMIK